MMPFLIIFACFLLSMILTGSVRRGLAARAVLDMPNERSSHITPVPRGGGWALLIILIPALIFGIFIFDGNLRHLGLVIGMLLLAVISWVDDRRHVSPATRLSLHILAACLGSLSFPPDHLLLQGVLPFWFDRLVMILGWAWFINLYNFMDGIDGITGVETISIASGICLIISATGIADPYLDFMSLVLIGGCLGFLAYNWHPARIFLGDVGSVPLGYVAGFGLIALATQGHLAAALILPLYYLADSGITITRRALRGEKIWQAHRQHFYQKSALGAGRHDKVVLLIILANIGLMGAALLSLATPFWGIVAAFAIVAILLGKMHKMSQPNSL
jgi:UDP-N-acetylmuramyl pentapeptide phosphotransferase/UDP-N-acetylglucosamine-1-phosphate transferase